MELYIGLGVIVLFIFIISLKTKGRSSYSGSTKLNKPQYFYAAKESIMTEREAKFYKRLEQLAGERYYIFPQIYLSTLLSNRTKGRYHNSAFQHINRKSVDYVFCDKQTLRPIYAIELDDSTHDTAKRRARDARVEKILADIELPLVRFRDIQAMSDEDMIEKFRSANSAT